jgi:tetratricopeptide (TPR) repeat protein
MQRCLALLAALIAIPAARAETFVVLPFFNESKKPNLDWVGESIAESIRDVLAARGILVLSRAEREEGYARLNVRRNSTLTHATVVKIGETLDAGSVIFGSFEVRPQGETKKDSLRIAVRIIDLGTMRQHPEYGQQGAFEDLATLQHRVAWQTLRFIAADDAPGESEFLAAHPPVRVDAVENYIRGLLAATTDQKQRFFAQAARLDPSYSEPAFELAELYYGKESYRPAAEWYQKVKPTDSQFRRALFRLGLSRFYLGDYTNAQAAFEKVLQSVPLNEVFNNLGAAQSRRNRPEALDNFRKALEGDSTDPDYHFNVAYALWKSGQFDAAAQAFRDVLERDPDDAEATAMLGRCLQRANPRTRGATQPLERVKEEFNESVYWQLKEALEPKKP